MPSWIWTQSDLMQLAGHNRPMVRQWACERLQILYGKAGREVLERLLEDKDPGVLLGALNYVESFPEKNFGDLILKAYEMSTDAAADRCALILGKLQDERLISAFDRKRKAKTVDPQEKISIIASLGELATDPARSILRKALSEVTEEADPYLLDVLIRALLKAKEDISVLLEAYARLYRKRDMEILYPFTQACGSWYALEDLKMEGKKKLLGKNLPPVVRENLGYLKDKGFPSLAQDLRQAFSQGGYRQVVEMAWQWTEKSVDEKGERVKEELSLKSDLPPSVNYQVLRAFKDFLGAGHEDSFKGLATATLVILAKFIEFENLWGLQMEEVDPRDVLPSLFGDRDTLPLDDALIEKALALYEPQTLFDQCVHQLEAHPDSYGTERVLRMLGKLKDPRAIPFLLPFLKRGENDDLKDESVNALISMGPPAVDSLEKNFNRLTPDQLSEILFVLRDIPDEKTADFILRHWEKLWSIDKESFLDALEGIASRRFIEPLRKELREGEGMEEEVFYLLCHLHGAKDDLLSQIEKNMAERKKKIEKTLEAWRKDDSLVTRQETAKVELRCRRCGKPYHYEVENIYLLPGKEEEPAIGDKIVCKNCRAINQYEITAKGHLAITSHMVLAVARMDRKRGKPGEGPIKMVDVGLVDGRRMSREEALQFYQDEVRKSPEDPALRVGYGNVLLKKGMEEEAIRQYKEALRLDPLAVEAYASLGEFEADKGRPSGAYEYFRKAAERIHTGHYYRTKEIDRLKEAVILSREYFEGVLGKSKERVPDTPSPGIIKREKTGRNAPCPCGSGKKYKKCCLNKDEAARPEKTSVTPVESALRDQLLSFSGNERYKKYFEKAYSFYWRKPFHEPLVLDEKKEAGFGFFLDCFIHDFRLGNGSTIIEEFYQEKKGKLSLEECSLLQSQIASHLSLYEVLEVTPEVGLKVRDLFSGEILDILEVRGTRALAKWDIIFARVIKMGPVNKFSGMIDFIPRREKDGVLSSVRQAWEKFKQETGKTEWFHFAKLKAYQIHHMIEHQPRIEPVFLTEERHPIVSSKAIFAAKDFDPIRYRFRREFDFVLDEEDEGKKMQWTWLKRGESKDWESGDTPEHGMVLKSEIIMGEGELKWVSLGTVTWTPGRLELWCLSKERLNRGKKRLREILGDDIRHLADTYEDIRKTAKRKSKEDAHAEDEAMQENFLSIFSKTMEEWATHWIDERIPALDGKTPREAVGTPEGRKQVEELLKDFENMEERKRGAGEPYIDIQVLRRMLNL